MIRISMEEWNWIYGIWHRRCDGSPIPAYGISSVEIIKSSAGMKMIKCEGENEYRFLIRKKLDTPTPSNEKIIQAAELITQASKDIEELAVTTAQFQIIKSTFRRIFDKGFDVFNKGKLIFKSLVN